MDSKILCTHVHIIVDTIYSSLLTGERSWWTGVKVCVMGDGGCRYLAAHVGGVTMLT